jgi:hypothetical protein
MIIKKALFIILPLAMMTSNVVRAQQSIVDKINTQLDSSGCGIAHFTIKYSSANYSSREAVVVSKDSASATNVTIHAFLQDTSKTGVDTTFILSSSQLTSLLNFYQSASSNTNPDPSLSAVNSGTANLIVTVGCAGSNDLTYSSSVHISLYRTILSNWNNWYH